MLRIYDTEDNLAIVKLIDYLKLQSYMGFTSLITINSAGVKILRISTDICDMRNLHSLYAYQRPGSWSHISPLGFDRVEMVY